MFSFHLTLKHLPNIYKLIRVMYLDSTYFFTTQETESCMGFTQSECQHHLRPTIHVRDPRGQGRDAALPPMVLPTGHCVAVARQQNCMANSNGGNMCVGDTVCQGRNVATSKSILSTSDGGTIAHKQHSVEACDG